MQEVKITKLSVTLRQLRAFYMVNILGGFSAAADKLSMTQGALSYLISTLERQIGFKLFERTTRKLELTPEGVLYLTSVEKILNQIDKLNSLADDIRLSKNTSFTLGSTAALIASEIAAVVHHFSSVFPSTKINLIDYQPDDLVEAVENCIVDLAIGPTRITLKKTVEQKLLFKSPLRLIVSKDHPFGLQKSVRWNQLFDQTLILQSRKSLLNFSYSSGVDFSNQKVIELSQLHSILSLVEAGGGVTLIADYALKYSSVHRVVSVPLVCPEVAMEVVLHENKNKKLSDAACAFKKFLLEKY